MTDPGLADPVHDLYGRLLGAWNQQSAEDFAALFADQGAMIGFDGSQAAGSKEVLEHLRPIFEDHATGTYVAKVREVRSLGSTSVMLRAIVGMVPPGEDDLNPEVNALQTVVAVQYGVIGGSRSYRPLLRSTTDDPSNSSSTLPSSDHSWPPAARWFPASSRLASRRQLFRDTPTKSPKSWRLGGLLTECVPTLQPCRTPSSRLTMSTLLSPRPSVPEGRPWCRPSMSWTPAGWRPVA